jgi:hypothetical protein
MTQKHQNKLASHLSVPIVYNVLLHVFIFKQFADPFSLTVVADVTKNARSINMHFLKSQNNA